MSSVPLTRIRFGFVPLIDCAIPVVAQEKGFAARHGLDLDLQREASWAAMRDKLAYGVLDAAHILAGIPLACAVGAAGAPRVDIVSLMALGRGGNSITVSVPLHQRMLEADPDAMGGPRAQSARALRKVIEADRAAKRPLLSFATVFPVSSHNFELRYWLAAAGIDPDVDVNLGVIAPPRMAESLRLGHIDGYCVGEPWGLRAVEKGVGVVVATKSDIFPAAPEKVLGVRREWVDQNPALTEALICAFTEAAMWADEPGNRDELAMLLSQEEYLGASPELLKAALSGCVSLKPGDAIQQLPDRYVFSRWQSTFPWPAHGHWLLSQMQRWKLWNGTADERAQVVNAVYRPDLYRHAVQPLGIAVPANDLGRIGEHQQPFTVPAEDGSALELGPDAFMDGRVFDPTE